MKSPYCFSVRSQEPLFSGFVLQSLPLRPTSTPSSTVHSPPYITTQPVMSRPLKSDSACRPPVVEQPTEAPRSNNVANADFFMANVVTVGFYLWRACFTANIPCTKQPSNI